MSREDAERRLKIFERAHGSELVELASHAALPVVLNPDFVHLLRVNYFLDPPVTLPYAAEADLLLSQLCTEIDDGLYVIDPELRDVLLEHLVRTHDGTARLRDVARLLWEYGQRAAPWPDRAGLPEAQQLSALNFIDPPRAQNWLTRAKETAGTGPAADERWFVAMREDLADRSAAVRRAAEEAAAASQAADPRPNGCHAIVWTPTERERNAARLLLVDNGLSPWQVWANTEMTSYAVTETDKAALARRIDNLRPNLLYKVVPGGLQDQLIQQVTVIDQAGREFPMYEVPVQLTIGDLADIAVHMHPSAESALVGGLDEVTYEGMSVNPASTLSELKFRNLARVTFGSIRFGTIKVLCIGASPEGMPRIDFAREVDAIRDKASLGRIELVGQWSHAKLDDLYAIDGYKPDVIHLSCHGEGLNLIIEDDEHDPFPVSAASFAQLLIQWQDLHARRLSAIVLNSCSGERIGPVLLEATRKFIGHERTLAGPRAELFTEKLYHELSRIPVLDAAALLAARSIYPDGQGLLILPPPRSE
jgi:hypothetical protein